MRRFVRALDGRDDETGTLLAVYRYRRLMLILRTRRRARRVHSTVELELARDLKCDRGAIIEVWPRTHSRLSVGTGSRLRRNVVIQLKGGTAELGERVDVRRGTRFSVAGHFTSEGRNIYGDFDAVHCANRVIVREMAAFSEYVVIADSSHTHTDPENWFYHDVKAGTVEIGRNTWLAAKATIARGAVVGNCCVVAANAVVIGTVPDNHFASGNPCEVRPLPYSWAESAPASTNRNAPR